MTPEAIRELRLRLNLTQTEFGAKLSRSKQAVSGWEKGHRNPDRLAVAAMREMMYNLDTEESNENS